MVKLYECLDRLHTGDQSLWQTVIPRPPEHAAECEKLSVNSEITGTGAPSWRASEDFVVILNWKEILFCCVEFLNPNSEYVPPCLSVLLRRSRVWKLMVEWALKPAPWLSAERTERNYWCIKLSINLTLLIHITLHVHHWVFTPLPIVQGKDEDKG